MYGPGRAGFPPPGSAGAGGVPRITRMSRRTVYADHHATTPLRPEALEAMRPWLEGLAANPSSIHAPGRAARKAVESARESVASALGAAPDEVVFTSGGTESDALAVCGAARAVRAADAARGRVAFSAAEHAAVREAALALRAEGFEAVELPVGRDGLPREPELGAALDGRSALVSLILAGNETGIVNLALPEAAAAARRAGVLLHTDAVQAVGKVPVSPAALGVDLLSFTAHKLGGPKGAGVLWVRRGVRLAPLFAGGGQERGRRGGTENVAAIAGLSASLRAATAALEGERRRITALRDAFEEGLLARVPLARVNGRGAAPDARLPTASSVTFPGVDGETLLVALDLEGVAASSGSACASGTPAPSRVLLATGMPAAEVKGTLRFSFGWSSTEEDVATLLELLPGLVERCRAA